MELVVIPTSTTSMEAFSAMIKFIVSNNFNLLEKNLFPSQKLLTESIPSRTIKKPKINSFIISAMEAVEIFMSLQLKVETPILTDGEIKLASNLETV